MISLRRYVLAKAGRRDEAEQVLSTLTTISQERHVPPYAVRDDPCGARTHRARTGLHHAYNVRDLHVIWLPMDPKLDPLRNDASFVRLIERCGFRGSGAARIN